MLNSTRTLDNTGESTLPPSQEQDPSRSPLDYSLTGKTALVTGAAGIMGKAVVKALAELDLTVILVDLSKPRLEELAAQYGKMAHPLVLDISSPREVESGILKLEREVGSVDILVNCAGILSKNKSQTTEAEEWQRVVDINLNGMFYLCKAVIPGMKKKGWGRIVNVSSLAAKSGGITAGTAYSASKGGVNALTFSLAAETAPFGITVNGIAPAYVKTPMITEQLTEEERQGVLKKIPVGRFCEPEEFAHVVLFLISPLAGFITGEIIDLNGGLWFD